MPRGQTVREGRCQAFPALGSPFAQVPSLSHGCVFPCSENSRLLARTGRGSFPLGGVWLEMRGGQEGGAPQTTGFAIRNTLLLTSPQSQPSPSPGGGIPPPVFNHLKMPRSGMRNFPAEPSCLPPCLSQQICCAAVLLCNRRGGPCGLLRSRSGSGEALTVLQEGAQRPHAGASPDG
jgi:hypothetical protein